jgi:large subunit ribosomal protein L25
MIQVPAKSLSEFFRHHTTSGMADLALENQATPVLLRDIERHPISGEILHLDFQRVDLGEVIKTTVPIAFHGADELTKNGLVLQTSLTEIGVQARAEALPEFLVVDVGQAHAGHPIHASDLQLPAGVQLTGDPAAVVASVTAPSVPAEVAAALDAEEAAHAQLAVSHGTASEEEAEEAEEAGAAVAGQ